MAGALDWNTEVLPLLEAAYGQLGTPAGFADEGEVDAGALNMALGREPRDRRTTVVLRQLEASGYIRTVHENDQVPGPSVFALEDRALQLVAGWPSGSGEALLDKLLSVLDERIAAEPDEERRGRLVRLRDSLVGAGRDVVIGVLGNVVSPGGPFIGS